MIVRSSKTEHHEGKAFRVVPLFSELRPLLNAVWDEAEENAQFVITRYRSANTNLRTQLTKIIARAGVAAWPKLFQNLRASRATELATEYPAHVAAAWLGHSTVIAAKHYWQVTDADFERAANVSADQDAAQKAAQQLHAESELKQQPTPRAQKESPVLQGFAAVCVASANIPVPPDGLEPSTL